MRKKTFSLLIEILILLYFASYHLFINPNGIQGDALNSAGTLMFFRSAMASGEIP